MKMRTLKSAGTAALGIAFAAVAAGPASAAGHGPADLLGGHGSMKHGGHDAKHHDKGGHRPNQHRGHRLPMGLAEGFDATRTTLGSTATMIPAATSAGFRSAPVADRDLGDTVNDITEVLPLDD